MSLCQKNTKHKYQSVSVIAFLLLLVICFPFAFVYLYIALKRADRSAYCTVNHEALRTSREDERMRELVLAMQQANGTVSPPARGAGFMTR